MDRDSGAKWVGGWARLNLVEEVGHVGEAEEIVIDEHGPACDEEER